MTESRPASESSLHGIAPIRAAPPEWFAAAMPQGYQTRLGEIRRLTAELNEMESYGRLLIETGAPLANIIRATFAAMKYEVTDLTVEDSSRLGVWLDNQRRLFVCVAAGVSPVDRKSPDVARAFALLQEHAQPGDRVVLALNVNAMRPPAERGESVTSDGLDLLERLGINVVTGPALFSLWTLSQQEPTRVQKSIDRLYAQDGGLYTTAAS